MGVDEATTAGLLLLCGAADWAFDLVGTDDGAVCVFAGTLAASAFTALGVGFAGAGTLAEGLDSFVAALTVGFLAADLGTAFGAGLAEGLGLALLVAFFATGFGAGLVACFAFGAAAAFFTTGLALVAAFFAAVAGFFAAGLGFATGFVLPLGFTDFGAGLTALALGAGFAFLAVANVVLLRRLASSRFALLQLEIYFVLCKSVFWHTQRGIT
jgi:hypothetical protein